MKNRVLMVMTRDIPQDVSNGRERTLSFIRKAIGDHMDVTEFKIRSVFEDGGWRAKIGAAVRVGWSVLRGAPCALQVAMFSHPRKRTALLRAVERIKPDVIYFDGIRLVDYAILVRRSVPGCRIIVDFDDLMSRRANILREQDFPLSAGYLEKSIPGPFVRLANARLVRNAFLGYEAFALKRQERAAIDSSHAVTLVSTEDAQSLRRSLTNDEAVKTHVIAPPMHALVPMRRPTAPFRFVFIGSDRQLQNRLAIEYLVALWARIRPATPLVIYGRMVGRYAPVPNVEFAGFAPTQADVYTGCSIALCPAFLRGGIKSKVLEAVSYGCVPVGNEAAFEGLGFHDEALAMSDARLERFVADPAADLDRVVAAATRFAAYCEQHFSMPVFDRRWRELIAPMAGSPS
ncbi:glycosyltransferase family 4 protein [Burkholderia cenocepacia]|uniref:glycosyltransferase n=1 Tax=Burkholderia cepacia complex TaxID=87882 RepID=UPI00163B35D8|nr:MULTISPECIES: glycosyltransferase [Burkholderia cepacia complex]ELW9447900.1 glycosyltransferase family 4 protein [Burkholderia cenocepacia]MBR8482241.1 glycosyltransferase family 4 protein [Burkholderia cenocepacia]MDN7503224.1 glycosyltransferase [Burkholderia orbicola]